jgi:hypothetical protein
VAAASLNDPGSIKDAAARLRQAVPRVALAPCMVGPELTSGTLEAIAALTSLDCAPPLGSHPAVGQLVAIRYGAALADPQVAAMVARGKTQAAHAAASNGDALSANHAEPPSAANHAEPPSAANHAEPPPAASYAEPSAANHAETRTAANHAEPPPAASYAEPSAANDAEPPPASNAGSPSADEAQAQPAAEEGAESQAAPAPPAGTSAQ